MRTAISELKRKRGEWLTFLGLKSMPQTCKKSLGRKIWPLQVTRTWLIRQRRPGSSSTEVLVLYHLVRGMEITQSAQRSSFPLRFPPELIGIISPAYSDKNRREKIILPSFVLYGGEATIGTKNTGERLFFSLTLLIYLQKHIKGRTQDKQSSLSNKARSMYSWVDCFFLCSRFFLFFFGDWG